MDRWDFNWYTPAKPKDVQGGIKLNSKRGDIVSNWWGKLWIKTLESYHIGERLNRGKRYARRGQVMNLDISDGQVTAQVQGTYSDPYNIKIRFKSYTDAQWKLITEHLNENPLWTANLLNGILPRDIELAFDDLRLPLLPSRMADLKTECDCPDFSNPCKHVAAVLFILAEAFDHDPFIIFELRGRPREQLFSSLQESGDILPEDALHEYAAEPLPQDPLLFWGNNSQPTFRPPTRLSMHAAIPRRLGPLNFWRANSDFISWMGAQYSISHFRALSLSEKLAEAMSGRVVE